MKRLLVVPFLAVALVLAAGCGGSDDSDTSATDQWADDLCSAITTWTGAISSATQELKSNPSKDGLQSAADEAKSATETFSDDLKGLGKPDTEAGQQAKDELDQLSSELSDEAQKLEAATQDVSGVSGLASAVTSVTGTLTTMGSQLSSAFSDLQSLDAKGELESALEQSSSCQSLTGSGS
jgi:hypothetical protein